MESHRPPSPKEPVVRPWQRPSLSWRPPPAGEEEPQAKQPQPQAQAVPAEPAAGPEGKAWHMGVVANSVTKFHHLPRMKRNQIRSTAPMTTTQQEETEEEYCGLWCVGVTSCQRFNNIYCVLFFFYLLLMSQGIVFALVDVSIELFQRGNGLRNTESILLLSSYDISSCLVVLFIAYYGGRGNILQWISVSSFLVGFGSLLFAFPYFSGEDYKLDIKPEDVCEETRSLKACENSIPFESKYVTFFMIGQAVQGIAGMPLYILTVIFLDDRVSRFSIGTYLGLMEASVTLGYALGYAIAAPLIATTERSVIKRLDGGFFHQHWFGTWWIRFVFVTVIAWSTLIAFLCFPQHIKGLSRIKSGKRQKPTFMDKKYKDQEFATSISDLFTSIWILIKTPIFVCLALTKASESLLLIGATQYLSKYIENQFILSPFQATILSGLVLIPGGAFGQVLGGVIASKLHMYCKGLMRFTMVTSAISLVLVMFAVFVRCNPIPYAGINEDYNGTGQLGNLTAPCNSHCQCSSSFYLAVCGRDGIAYFSPCFAGCNQSKTFKNEKRYFNCSCIDEGIAISDDQGDFIDAKSGTCKSGCYKLPMFIVFIFSTIVFAGFSGIPIMLTILRIVPEKQRSLAIGLTYVILRVFGTIPGPIVFKMVGETSCTFRDSGHCGNTGSCWIYDSIKMAYLFSGICVFCKLTTIFFTAIAFALYKRSVKDNTDAFAPDARKPKGKQKEKRKK